ncbi:MAG: (Fe-S)-binding protein [Desulfobulbaceae bacterium]|nr:(Fe-S)-binding protein [Desulfobulbaceae bacterium]
MRNISPPPRRAATFSAKGIHVTDCAKCGACTVVCPVYQVTGQEFLTARGKIHLLERLPVANCSAAYADILSKCLLCGACVAVCPRQVDTPALVARARQELPLRMGEHPFLSLLARKALAHPPLLTTLASIHSALDHLLPAESGLRLRLGLTPPATRRFSEERSSDPTPPGRAEVDYFSGCLARHLQPEISAATVQLTAFATGTPPLIPHDQACCGQAAFAAGSVEEAQALARRNIAAFAGDQRPILTSCASCFSHLKTYPVLLADDPAWSGRARAFAERLREFASFFAGIPDLAGRRSPSRGAGQTVLHHDPCHLRFRHQLTAPPRQLLNAVAGLTLRELPHGPQCCGMGGLFHLAHPTLSRSIRDRLLDDFAACGADLVTTTCTGCLLQWQQGLAEKGYGPARHLAVVVAQRLVP